MLYFDMVVQSRGQGSADAAAAAAAGLFVLVPCCFFIFMFGIGVVGTAFWVWMLVDCAKNEPSDDKSNDKVVWILLIILTHLVGAMVYYFVRRPQRKRLHGK